MSIIDRDSLIVIVECRNDGERPYSERLFFLPTRKITWGASSKRNMRPNRIKVRDGGKAEDIKIL
ncbi:hypothetical protein [Rhizobium sp. No.120]